MFFAVNQHLYLEKCIVIQFTIQQVFWIKRIVKDGIDAALVISALEEKLGKLPAQPAPINFRKR
ncbi:hypothetical protein ATE72_04750 [Sphingopyxis sp. HXXIV]|nr:hypothetical protein ATE72_04750 [Sphingopyxis sp. HXXIV]